MRYTYILIATVVIVGSATLNIALAQSNSNSKVEMSNMTEKMQDYVCPMHPHIHGSQGDNCPICGMPLVPAKTNEVQSDSTNLSEEDLEGSHHVDPSLVQTIGIKTAPVKLEVFGDDMRAYGRVVPSTRVASNVTLRIEGWVEDLAASAIGDPVEKGERLFSLNSPQLISAQTDYITALELDNKDIAKAAISRLKQLGVDDKSINLIKKDREVLTSVPFHAPASGIVTTLNIRTGDYVKPGTLLIAIQDLSTIWVEADVPERNLANLKQGDRVMVSLPELGKKRLGKITYIQPSVDPQTRTGEVRIELKNPDGSLKPDSFVDVTFTSEKRHRLAIPHQALLRSSMGDYVLRWLGEGRFKPVMVKTGVRSDEFVEIRSGLQEGHEIVTSGQFLLDAEANLKSGMGSMSGHNHNGDDIKESQQESTGGNPHAGH